MQIAHTVLLRRCEALLDRFAKLLSAPAPAPDTAPARAQEADNNNIYRVNSFLFQSGLDNVNMFELDKFMDMFGIAKKVSYVAVCVLLYALRSLCALCVVRLCAVCCVVVVFTFARVVLSV